MLVLQMSAPGLMSSPALAALMGLDVALTLASLIVSTAITPLTASLFTHVFLGTALASPLAFGLRLFLIIAGCAFAAGIVRRIAGRAWVDALALIAITALVFVRAGRARALAIGLIAGNRNVGLMLAATGFVVPDVAWLYFALAQFPIYLLPHLLKPLTRRLQQSSLN